MYGLRKRHRQLREAGREDAERGIPVIQFGDSLSDADVRAYWRGWRQFYNGDLNKIRQVCNRMGMVPREWMLRDRGD